MGDYLYDHLREYIVSTLGNVSIEPKNFSQVLLLCMRFVSSHEKKFAITHKKLEETRKRRYAWDLFVRILRENKFDIDCVSSSAPETLSRPSSTVVDAPACGSGDSEKEKPVTKIRLEQVLMGLMEVFDEEIISKRTWFH